MLVFTVVVPVKVKADCCGRYCFVPAELEVVIPCGGSLYFRHGEIRVIVRVGIRQRTGVSSYDVPTGVRVVPVDLTCGW